MKEVMLFHAGNQQFGLELAYVKGVFRSSDLEEAADAAFRIQDQEMPMYDLSDFVPSKNGGADPAFQKVMRIEVQNVRMAMRVDSIDRVVEVNEKEIDAIPPVFKGRSLDWFPWILKHENGLIPLLNPAGVMGLSASEPEGAPSESETLERFLAESIGEDRLEALMIRSIQNHVASVMERELRILKTQMAGDMKRFFRSDPVSLKKKG